MLDALQPVADRLSQAREPYALAIVVRHEPPISGKPGDKAIIRSDGSLTGWIGGGCTRDLIVDEAINALTDAAHRLVRITPRDEPQARGIISHAMTCHSGGALDVYIEPVMPKPQLILFGRTELAHALCRLASAVGYRVVALAPGADPDSFDLADQWVDKLDLSSVNLRGPTFAVVATQGEHDEQALTEALNHPLPYVAFVASRRKAAQVLDALASAGQTPEALKRIQAPAGIDIGARLPEEIAVSILAQIVSFQRKRDPDVAAEVDASMPREIIQIEGMSCAHCVMTVRRALSSLQGITVHEVGVGHAEVSYSEGKACREELNRALDEAGFSVRLQASA